MRKTPKRDHALDTQEEEGHIMVLLIGFVLIALLLITVVAASSSLYIAHKKLLSMADGAALAGADTFVLNGGTTTSDPGTLLTDQGVTAAALGYLSENEVPGSLSGVRLDVGTGSVDGRTAQVSLTGVVHPMFINFLVPDGIVITATGTARAQLVQ